MSNILFVWQFGVASTFPGKKEEVLVIEPPIQRNVRKVKLDHFPCSGKIKKKHSLLLQAPGKSAFCFLGDVCSAIGMIKLVSTLSYKAWDQSFSQILFTIISGSIASPCFSHQKITTVFYPICFKIWETQTSNEAVLFLVDRASFSKDIHNLLTAKNTGDGHSFT